MTRFLSVPRSLVFYFAFYLGTLIYVLTAIAAKSLVPRAFMPVVRDWSRHHRRCLRLAGIRIVIAGEVPRREVLVAVKHESFLEAIDLPAMYGEPLVFAKAELLDVPLWGTVGRLYGLIPVQRDQGAGALRAMIAAARAHKGKGLPYVIFPEGTRMPHGTAPPLQAGFAGLYKLLGLPVVPVSVDSGVLYHRTWKLPGTVTFRFGEEIPPGLPRAEIEARVHAAINTLNPVPETQSVM